MNGKRGLSARFAPSLVRSIAATGLLVACLLLGLGLSVASAAPVAPAISGPTAIQFAYHPAGFRAALTWEPVPSATEYQIFHADTDYFVGSVAGTSAVVYGMQNVVYHYYVVAVDSAGATSTPSNVVDILTSAPVPPALPSEYEVLPQSVFGISSASATGTLSIKIPYDPAQVSGNVSALRMMHYDNGVWMDVTTSVDSTRSFVLGSAAPNSVFAVVEVEPIIEQVTRVTTTELTGSSVVRVRRVATFVGTVSPAPLASTVTVRLQRFVQGSWITAGTTTLSVSDGSFVYRFPRSAKGTYRLRASYTGTTLGMTSYAPSVSAFKVVSVR